MQRQQHVIYAGYKVPHPLDHAFVLKVQTDKTTTPTESLQAGIDTLIGDLAVLEERLAAEVKRASSAAPTAARSAW